MAGVVRRLNVDIQLEMNGRSEDFCVAFITI